MADARPAVKVMHVINGLQTGGAERILQRLVLASRPRPLDQRVVSLVPGGAVQERLLQAGVPVANLGMRRGWPDPRAVLRLARLIRREKPDVVQSWLYHADLVATLALLLSGRRRKTRLFWNLRCSSMEGAARSFAQRVALFAGTRLSRLPDAVIANSESGRAFHARVGYRPRRFLVIDNGIDAEPYRFNEAARQQVRGELGIPESRNVIAMVARCDPVKDHPTFLKAFALIPGISALLIGGGTESLEPQPNLFRLGERDDVPRLLAACDLVVSSSTSEGFPNALLEGMAAGLPAVATDAGDSRRVVGDTGITVPVGDPAALAAGIRHLLNEDPSQRRVRREAARRRATETFGLPRMVAAFDALYAGEA